MTRDDRALGADDDVIFESHFAHQFDDVLDLLAAVEPGFMTTIMENLRGRVLSPVCWSLVLCLSSFVDAASQSDTGLAKKRPQRTKDKELRTQTKKAPGPRPEALVDPCRSVSSERAAPWRVVIPAKKEAERVVAGPNHCDGWYTRDTAGVNRKPQTRPFSRLQLTSGRSHWTTRQPTGA